MKIQSSRITCLSYFFFFFFLGGGGGGVADVRCSHAWMRYHLTLELQEFFNDIFSIIMFLFWIQLNNKIVCCIKNLIPIILSGIIVKRNIIARKY